MPSLAALLLITPVFGFALQPPLLVDDATDAVTDAVTDAAPSAEEETIDVSPEGVARAAAVQEAAEEAEADRRYTEEVRQRRELSEIHRALGITTWVSMTATVILGFIQYYNLYGIGAGQDDNPCATGHAVFGQDQCYGAPWPHRISAITTTALYATTFTLSLVMPDPNHASEGPGHHADIVRAHEALRWVHLIGMVAQIGLGIVQGSGAFGDRANDYGTLQAVASVHQYLGWVTWGALTAAGAIMIF